MKRYSCFLICFFFLVSVLAAQNPTQWRGDHSDGKYTVDKLLNKWPAEGPQILWHTEGLGQGFSSPAFANSKIYVTGMLNGQAVLFVLDMNGKELKRFSYGAEFAASYPGTRSTPTIVDNLAYLYTGNGQIICLDLNSGATKWTKNVFSDFDGQNITWGVTESLVVNGDKLYCTPGGKKNNVIALNRLTGNLIWTSPGVGELSAYCTPQIIKLPARTLVVTMTASHVVGIDDANGNVLWSWEHPNQWSVHPNTPIYNDGALVCFSGYGQGAEKLILSADGSSITKAWAVKSFDSRMGGAVLVNGCLYGSGDADRSWQCIDWKTGEQKYSSTAVGKGVVIAANNKLIGYSERGELFLADATPVGLTIASKTKVELGSEQHWAHPVIFNNVLYVRHGNTLIAYKISE
jgi:outer membrane protein assembly factor BamB